MPLTVSALFATIKRIISIFKSDQIREPIPETTIPELILKTVPLEPLSIPKSVLVPFSRETEPIECLFLSLSPSRTL